METATKNKILIFTLMTLVFLASVFLKQFLDTGSFLPVRDTAGVVRLDAGEENPDEAEGESAAVSDEEAPVATVPVQIVVDVEGAVVSPGVVTLTEGSRVYEAVEAAGGMAESADHGKVNLAEKVSDGMAVYIPFQGEEQSGLAPGISSGQTSSSGSGGLININTADKSALMQLPGIGEVYAQSIIDYRQSVGTFQKIEDIKNVSGIGDGRYEKIKDKITI